jgi:hypothetical protein
MCPLMQILAGPHCTKNFKCGLSTNSVLHVHNALWAYGAVWHWVQGHMCLVQYMLGELL